MTLNLPSPWAGLDRPIPRPTDTLPNRLRRLRRVRGLSQQQLAKECQIARGSFSKYELGLCVPSYQTILIMCRVLQVSPNELMGWET